MNADHGEAVKLYATVLLGLPDGDWRLTGIDPQGIDLAAGTMRGRLDFSEMVSSAGALRHVLANLAEKARRMP
jgi:putative heme iron utilization protein